jgi:hypothetical protein
VLRARGFRRARVVRLMDGARELAKWRFRPDEAVTALAEPFRLPEGEGRLRLLVSGVSEPGRVEERAIESDDRAFGLLVEEVALVQVPGE